MPTAAPDGPEIAVTGKEFGNYKDIKDLKGRVSAWYRETLQGKAIERDGFGPVRMTGKGLKETLYNAGDDKLMLVKYVPDIIRKGAIGAEEPLKHPRKDGIVSFIPITARIKISDKDERIVGVLIGKDEKGRLYYDTFIERKSPPEVPGVNSRGPDGAGEPKALLDNNIFTSSGDVKGKNASEAVETAEETVAGKLPSASLRSVTYMKRKARKRRKLICSGVR